MILAMSLALQFTFLGQLNYYFAALFGSIALVFGLIGVTVVN